MYILEETQVRKRFDLSRYQKKVYRNYKIIAIVVVVVMAIFVIAITCAQKQYYESMIKDMATEREEALAHQQSQFDERVREMQASYDNLNDAYNMLQSLYDQQHNEDVDTLALCKKYDYVIERIPEDSGLSIKDITYLDFLAKELDVNPHLMWSIYWVESKYHTNVNSSQSTARGLGQILSSTGEYVYENLLHKGTYSHEMAYNPQMNMYLTTNLMRNNLDKTSSVYGAVCSYGGGENADGYYQKVLSTARYLGVDISSPHYQ